MINPEPDSPALIPISPDIHLPFASVARVRLYTHFIVRTICVTFLKSNQIDFQLISQLREIDDRELIVKTNSHLVQLSSLLKGLLA